ncbi:MAG: hypothetical protein ACRET2_09635 [Steroidobacteraceae bacterium]
MLRAIKAGILTVSTKAELETLEREKVELLAASTVAAPSEKVVRVIARVAEHYRRMVSDFEERAAQASPRDIEDARTDLRALLGAVRVEGVEERGQSGALRRCTGRRAHVVARGGRRATS